MAYAVCPECGKRYCTKCGGGVQEGTCEECNMYGPPDTESGHDCEVTMPRDHFFLSLHPGGGDGGVSHPIETIQARIDAARKLEGAGWSIQPSPQGLHCSPPGGGPFTVAGLRTLGIEEETIRFGIFSGLTFRGCDEIKEATDKLWAQFWYERHTSWLPFEGNEDERRQTVEVLEQILEEYGREEIEIEGRYEIGKMRGKLSALIWLQGYDWDLRNFGIDDPAVEDSFNPM